MHASIRVFGVLSLALLSAAQMLIRRPNARSALAAEVFIPVLVAAAVFNLGFRQIRSGSPRQRTMKVLLIQPSIPQNLIWDPGQNTNRFAELVAYSERALTNNADLLIWPESAFPFFLTREADAMAQIADLLPKGTVLITGAVRVPDDTPPGARVTRAYNSIYVIDHDGSVLSIYDKTHLVPFGEYLPFQNWMEKLGFSQLTKVTGGYIAGTRRRPPDIPNAPRALPLICYEAIFPGNVAERDDRAGWIVNLTNDGWFGISTGPYQHLQQARLRAIEEGLPVVRAANTGISAVIDPVGRIVAQLGLGIEGVLDASLPAAISPTIYARATNMPAAILMAIALIFIVRQRVKRRNF